jgi:hypothetical protein
MLSAMQGADQYLAMEDAALLAQCEVHTYKSSGPGGQHRNKVSSAVRLVHGPTRVSAHGDDSRSQHDNKRLALQRLRMNLAMHLRETIDCAAPPPAFVQECMFQPRGRAADAPRRLEIGAKDFRFWRVAAWLLDVLEACSGRVGDAAAVVGITTGNFSDLLTSERHLLAAAQEIRKRNSLKPLS